MIFPLLIGRTLLLAVGSWQSKVSSTFSTNNPNADARSWEQKGNNTIRNLSETNMSTDDQWMKKGPAPGKTFDEWEAGVLQEAERRAAEEDQITKLFISRERRK